jgi:hypothetical protein
VGLITAAQKVEHYEIAAYGCLATYAKLLGFIEDKALLGKSLDEEKSAEGKLTQLAEVLNVEAAKGEMPASVEQQVDEWASEAQREREALDRSGSPKVGDDVKTSRNFRAHPT